jgi:hypothetical protein
VLAGPIALVICAAMFLPSQRAALSATWVEPVNVEQVIKFFTDLFPPYPILIVAGAAGLTLLYRSLMRERMLPPRAVLAREAGLVALVLVAVVLLVFSAAVQPALVSRYAMMTVLGLPALAAYLLGRAPKPILIAACVGLIVIGSYGLQRQSNKWAGPNGYHNQLEAVVADLRRETGDSPILFDLRQYLYPVCHAAPDLAPRCFFWDFELKPNLPRSDFRICERDVARAIHRFYRPPGLLQEDRLAEVQRIYLVTQPLPETVRRVEQELPGYTPRQVGGSLFELVRAK